MEQTLFLEISTIVLVAVLCAGLSRLLGQPLIIGYVVAAILLGPQVLNVVTAHDAVGVLSEMGVAFLLFLVGLSLNPATLRQVGKISLITGIGQVIFTSVIGFFIGLAFGFDTLTSLYIAVALTFSSTIVIMKLLSDQKDTDSLYGKISIGFLIVQDIIAMLILMFVSASGSAGSLWETLLESLVLGSFLIATLLAFGKYVLSRLMRHIASSEEFLFIFCIAWCFSLATLFNALGFSIEIGALLAGVSLSLSPYRHEISVRIRPLRDFFLILFFVFLGTQMQFSDLSVQWPAIAVFSLFILIGNPLIVMILMGIMGYTKRTGLLSGFTVAQISEFSLLLVALGVKMNHIAPSILSLVTLVGLVTIAGSTYLIVHGKTIYKVLAPYLSVFERRGVKVHQHHSLLDQPYQVLMVGYNHIGSKVTETLKGMHKRMLVIDHDPEVVLRLTSLGVSALYGDAQDPDIFSALDLAALEMVICTTKDFDINASVLARVRAVNSKAVVIAVSEQVQSAIDLYEKGASYVIMPHSLGGSHTSILIEEYRNDLTAFLKKGLLHKDELRAQPRA